MKMTSNNRETTGKIKILNRMLLPAIAALLIVLTTPAHSVLPKEVQADLLANEITEAITQKNYARAEKLFNDYEELGLEIPPPLKAPRALAYYQLGKFDLALQELEQYLTAVERGSQGYERALAMYSDINKKEEKRKEEKLKKFLSAYGVTDINATNSQGKTALEQAVASGDMQGVKALITAGADINAKNGQGKTLLDQAIELGSKQAISILADAGVHVDLEAMLKSAVERNDVNKTRQLIRVGAKGGALLRHAIEKDAFDVVALLIEKGADINAKDSSGQTPLHDAARYNAVEAAALLIEKGANINVKNNYGETPLHFAARYNAVEAAALLIEKGANINVKNNYGETPLHFAAVEDLAAVAALLTEKGADINAKTKYGTTPLHYAALGESAAIAALLIEKGANINAKDNDGETPLDNAVEINATEVVALLRKAGAKTNITSTTRTNQKTSTSQKSSDRGDK